MIDVGDFCFSSMSDFLITTGGVLASGFSSTLTASGVSSTIRPVTDLPAFVVMVHDWYFSLILNDGSTMSCQISSGFSLASSFARSGPISVPTPLSLWQETQTATWNICLPLANDRPLCVCVTADARSSYFNSLRGRL